MGWTGRKVKIKIIKMKSTNVVIANCDTTKMVDLFPFLDPFDI